MLQKTLLLSLMIAAPCVYAASDLDNLGALSQSQFQGISKDLGAALSYKALAPAEPLGVTGFDIGVEVTATKLKSTDSWKTATGDDFDYLPVPKLHIHKGLPFDVDVGAFIAAIPGTDMKLYGGELRYAYVSGNTVVPAIAVRGAYSKLSGVDQLDFHATNLEVTISKGFAMLTPYAGVGSVWSTSTPNGIAGLKEEKNTQTRLFAGCNLNFGLVNMDLEADKTGENVSYGAKVGLRF